MKNNKCVDLNLKPLLRKANTLTTRPVRSLVINILKTVLNDFKQISKTCFHSQISIDKTVNLQK
jgi:hypothetical protein